MTFRPIVIRTSLFVTSLCVSLAAAAFGGVGVWTPMGPIVEDVYDLAIDPRTPSNIYVSAWEGLLQSGDGGGSWSLVEAAGRPGSTNFRAVLAVDFEDPPNVYAAMLATEGCTLLRSRDAGRSWIRTRVEIGDYCNVTDLAVDPGNPSTLYATTDVYAEDRRDYRGSVFRSEDSGGSWTDVGGGIGNRNPAVYRIAIDPTRPATLYAAASTGVWKSDDAGASWTSAGTGLPDPPRVYALAIDPRFPEILYAGTVDGVYKSTDGGGSWWSSYQPGLASPVDVLVIHPEDPDVVYAGTLGAGLHRSRDGGNTWVPLATDAGRRQMRALTVDPVDPDTLYAGTHGEGVLRSTDGGATWQALPTGFGQRVEVLALVTGQRFATTFYAVTRTAGVYRSDDEGRSWYPSNLGLETEAVTVLAIAPNQPRTLYAGTRGQGVWRSRDGGLSWSSVSSGLDNVEIYDLAVDPYRPGRVYAATSNGLRRSLTRSDDRGVSWSLLGFYGKEVRIVALSSDGGAVYAGNFDGLFRNGAGGGKWTQIYDGRVYSLALHPSRDGVLYLGTLDGVFRSDDYGATWLPSGSGFFCDPFCSEVKYLVVDPLEPSHIYGRYRSRLVESLDAGASWSIVGFWPVYESALTLHPWSPSTVYVGGYELMHPRCGDTALCFGGERFAAELVWRAGRGRTGIGRMAPATSDDSGVMWFFGEDNWEMLVKVLDGCGVNDRFWVFAAATTDVEYGLRVTDTLSGSVKSYFNPSGNRAAALTDTQAFATCEDTAPSDSVVWQLLEPGSVVPVDFEAAPASRSSASGGCAGTPKGLCLQEDRFLVEVRWQDSAGKTGSGHAVPYRSNDSGLMWFFGEDNWEMLVKVLDGCNVNERFWVFAAATTNVGYTLKVTDTRSGEVRRYHNPLGRAAAALTDTSAFATCSE